MDLEVTGSGASGLLAVIEFSGILDDQSDIGSYPSRGPTMKAFGDVDSAMLKPVRAYGVVHNNCPYVVIHASYFRYIRAILKIVGTGK